MRETTINAYKIAVESGLVSKLRLQVFKILCNHGPMTANEMRMHGSPSANSGVYSTRLSELERMGLVYEKEVRPCKTTGHKAIVWEVTGNNPVKLEKAESRKQKKIKAFNALNKLYRELRNGGEVVRNDFMEIKEMIKNI